MRKSKILGNNGEAIAEYYLRSKRYKILARNYRFVHNEIDIIAKKRWNLVFVEVKTRSTLEFGSGADAVDEKKRDSIRACARGYLSENPRQELRYKTRFDIISIIDDDLEHIQNAFGWKE